MAQSLSKVLLHVVFSTKNRANLILDEFKQELHSYLATTCRNHGSQAFRVGGTHNHVHIACTLPRTLTQSKLLEEIKKNSSKWMKQKSPRCTSFSWQSGYSVFSVSHSQLTKLIHYIENQEEHHKKESFKEELLLLLEKYEVEYDERYLWD